MENEKKEKFNVDKLFEKKQTGNKEEDNSEENKLAVIEKDSWYKVLIYKIIKKITKKT